MIVFKRVICFSMFVLIFLVLTGCNLALSIWGGLEESDQAVVSSGKEDELVHPPENITELSPYPVPTMPPIPPFAGTLYFDVETLLVDMALEEGRFMTKIYAASVDYYLTQFNLSIQYDESVISVYELIGNNGVEQGEDGFINNENSKPPNKLLINGTYIPQLPESPPGIGPGEMLHLLTIHWQALQPGECSLVLSETVLYNQFGDFLELVYEDIQMIVVSNSAA